MFTGIYVYMYLYVYTYIYIYTVHNIHIVEVYSRPRIYLTHKSNLDYSMNPLVMTNIAIENGY